MQSGHKSNAGLRKHDIKEHQVTATNLEHATATAMFTTMTVNATTTEDTLTVYESAVGNPSNPVEDESTENKSAVGEPAIGEPAIDESQVDESDLNEFDIEESDFEESDIEESDFEESDIEESDFDESNTEEYDFDESDIEESDFDESNIEESDFDEFDTEVSDLDDFYDFETDYSNIDNFDVYENTVDNVVANEHNLDEFKHFVNYIDQCNSDQHFIVKMHTKAIYNLKPLEEEPSALQFGRFTEKLVLHIWVLQMQDPLDIDRWSGLLMHIIYSKLDPATRNLWNKFVWDCKKHGRNVSMTKILDFLRATCREYEIKKPPRFLSCINCVYNDLGSKC
ncbi:uncharacterized protein LOC113550493 [Rhopalosiphum maidis]|uniref:uncharacterized protein LOC113550493 n=1 Tax=Rhopalosiphum maidis TaxID=43146 RepID=UPI000EFE835C|nr:uncharacterized protein LOC113550493 [Rhopalosiphum maidis]